MISGDGKLMDDDRSVAVRQVPGEPPLIDLSTSVAKRREKLAQMMARGEIINAELIAFAATARARIAAIED